MIWGIIDLIVIIFFISLILKLIDKVKDKIGKWIAAIAFVVITPAMVLAQEWVEVPHGEDYCPYGDAVITEKGNSNEPSVRVDCILYDRKQECWDTWVQNVRGDRLHQCWEVDQYDAWVEDGQLTIHPKTDEVVIRPTGRELNEAELQAALADIFKGVK